MAETNNNLIKVCEPRLPEADVLTPYIRQIDQARFYTNFGPLVRKLEQRLATHWSLPEDGVITTSSGTMALVMALRATDAPAGTLCMMPAWTFTASAHAVIAAGLVPYFVDVDADSWALEPDAAHTALSAAPATVGAVMPVTPYGAPIDADVWLDFQQSTGIPVVIDAAASFDTIKPGHVPAIISLHATKVMGIGEGGLVISNDAAFGRRVRGLSNFGFEGDRNAREHSFNAKLSEYAAAVGHAALDAWPYVRVGYASLARNYVAALSALPGISLAPGFGGGWASSTCVAAFEFDLAADVMAHLAAAGIQSHAWWGTGCHRQTAFKDHPRIPLPTTDFLAAHSLGLPFHLGLDTVPLNRVISALSEFLLTEAAEPQRAAAGGML